jgi:hypothetical protein
LVAQPSKAAAVAAVALVVPVGLALQVPPQAHLQGRQAEVVTEDQQRVAQPQLPTSTVAIRGLARPKVAVVAVVVMVQQSLRETAAAGQAGHPVAVVAVPADPVPMEGLAARVRPASFATPMR